MTVITEAAQVTPEWLTAVLRREGVLDRGEVIAVDAARLPHLALAYSADAPASAPAMLFLKIGRLGNPTGDLGPLEVAAYRAFEERRSRLPMLLRCYDSGCDLGTNASHLLLADFAATHSLPTFPVPLPDDRDAITGCTARFHASWWEYPQRDLFGLRDPNIDLDCTSADAYASYAARCQEAYPYFADFCGEKLPPAERSLYEALLAALPAFWTRYLAPRFVAWEAITLVQGDSHWGQFACPRQTADRRTFMLDLECLHWGLPAADLAYRIALDWTPEQRRDLERGLLDRYVERLREAGVQGYTPALCWQDYRLSVIFLTLYSLKRFTAHQPNRTDHQRMAQSLPGWWWPVHDLTLTNYRDLRCEELLS